VKLPNGSRALIDPLKLLNYSLAPEHDEGRHKAHLFETLLGINQENSDLLLNALKQVALSSEASLGKLDEYGQRYLIDFPIAGPEGSATIRSAWIVRRDEDFPRLVSCYIL
jgi:hypothetical protein